MDVIGKVSRAELAKLGMSKDQLYGVISTALDKAKTHQGDAVKLDHLVRVDFSND